jgi:hypothetical protein
VDFEKKEVKRFSESKESDHDISDENEWDTDLDGMIEFFLLVVQYFWLNFHFRFFLKIYLK